MSNKSLSPIFNGVPLTSVTGAPLSGGKIYTYSSGTVTPKATYKVKDGSVAHTNPIILNTLGMLPAPLWLNPGEAYTLYVTDSADVAIATFDNIEGAAAASSVFPPTGDLDMGGYKLTSLGTATAGTNALNRDAADARYLPITASANIAMGTYKITGLGNATADTDALNRITADGRYIANPLAADLAMGSHKLTGGYAEFANGTFGYASTERGSVSQSTSKSTSVTLNARCGTITTHNASLTRDASVTFTWTNSYITANSLVVLSPVGATEAAYLLSIAPTAGSAVVGIRNLSGADLAEAIAIRFAIILT